MKVDLAYGRSELAVEVPEDCDVTLVTKPPMPLIDEPVDAVRRALQEEPVDAQPLASLARGRRSACILICDVTRPVPNHLFLRPMIETLIGAGVPAAAITVLVATGLHRPNEGAELDAVIGDRWVLDTVAVVNHFARDDAAHVDLGVTASRGTPVKLDRRFVAADLRIATGLVEPHFMAGYSGGPKVVAPGIAHHETIRTFHSARFMDDPGAVVCNLTGNPLHEEQQAIIAMLGEVYAVNTVIDDARRLSLVNFGEIRASHRRAVAFVQGYCTVSVARRFHTLVTSAAGHPLDQTYYQTVKGMVTPLDVLEPGGTLIIASECSEGLGSDAFRAAQRRLVESGSAAFLREIEAKTLADVDEWQTQMLVKPQRLGSVQLYTEGLDAADRALTGVTLIDSIETAIAEAVARSGDPAVAVIPEGPYVVPQFDDTTV